MFLVGMISWWYGRGWRGQFVRVCNRLAQTADFFSIGELFKTLFAPFRQISAGSANGPFGAVIRAFFDRLLSRIIGSVVRTFTIVAGIFALLFQTLYEVVILVVWLFLPAFPIVGFIMMALGWVPKWM
jgi:hypothetical protein